MQATTKTTFTENQQHAFGCRGLGESIDKAKYLGCKTLITKVGMDLGIPRNIQEANLTEGLKACIPLLEKNEITLVYEPLNTLADHKGYYLYSSEEAFRIAKKLITPA